MTKLPKGFIGECNGNMVNIDWITDVKYFNGKCIAIDKFGIQHYASQNQEYKLEGRF